MEIFYLPTFTNKVLHELGSFYATEKFSRKFIQSIMLKTKQFIKFYYQLIIDFQIKKNPELLALSKYPNILLVVIYFIYIYIQIHTTLA